MTRVFASALAVMMCFATATTSFADVVFNSVPGPYVAFPAATGQLGIEDYQADLTFTPFGNNTQTDFIVQSMQFVGGVTVAGGTVQLRFLQSDATTQVAAFNVTLPSAGNFIWTITLPPTVIPRVGVLEINALSGALGQWFISDSLPARGTSPGNPDALPPAAGGPRVYAFNLDGIANIPEPTSIGILGLVVVAAAGLVRRGHA